MSEFFRNFLQEIEIAELCKGVHCVELGESFQTHMYLQNLDSIQPRTSPVKFGRSVYGPLVLYYILLQIPQVYALSPRCLSKKMNGQGLNDGVHKHVFVKTARSFWSRFTMGVLVATAGSLTQGWDVTGESG